MDLSSRVDKSNHGAKIESQRRDMECPLRKKANGVPMEGFCDFSKSSALSCQVAEEMVLSVNAVLFSAQPRACGEMHIWLVNHNQASMPRSLFIGWLSVVLYTFSVWIT